MFEMEMKDIPNADWVKPCANVNEYYDRNIAPKMDAHPPILDKIQEIIDGYNNRHHSESSVWCGYYATKKIAELLAESRPEHISK